jgi:ankyrin repeat protein
MGFTALHAAAWQGHLAIVQQLLAAGADLEATHLYGGTPLHEAARSGHHAVVQQLLAAGVNMEATNLNSGTPLHCTALRRTLLGLAIMQSCSNCWQLGPTWRLPRHLVTSQPCNLQHNQGMLRWCGNC